MSDSKRVAAHGGRPLLWIAALLFFALVVGYIARPQGQRATDTRRSSLRTTPDGVAALARGIDRLGRTVEPRITPLVDADPVRGTLVLLEPRVFPSPREVKALLDHVNSGGTLLYAPRYRERDEETVETALMDSLGVHFRWRSVVEGVRRDSLQHPEWGDHGLTEGLPAPRPLIHGFRVGGDGGDSVSTRVWNVRPLMGLQDGDEDDWFGAAELALGDGRVVVFAETEPLSNERAGDHPLAVLAVRSALSHTSEVDTVFFAEYHQGILGTETRARVLADFFLGRPRGRTLLHLIAVCFLILACMGLRFGAPAPGVAPPDRERRSPLEHVSALGDLYRKAGASNTAALRLLSRLARAARHPPPRSRAEADLLLGRLATGEGADAPLERVRRGLHADPADLTAIATGIDEHLARRSSP